MFPGFASWSRWPAISRDAYAIPSRLAAIAQLAQETGEVGDHSVSQVVWDIIIVFVIVCIGGFFAGAEMALVSLREGQIRSLARRGRRGAKAARLASDPNRFLSAVQIGTTLAMLVSGAYGAVALAGVLGDWLIRKGMSHDFADPLAFAI